MRRLLPTPGLSAPQLALSAAVALSAALLASLVAPASAAAAVKMPLAIDLFPVDDWIGDGLRKATEVTFGGLQIGVDAIAKLITATLGALVDLLVPKPFVDAGIDGVKWICAVPSFGAGSPKTGAFQLDLPHVEQLRSIMTWIGVSVLPLGLVYAGARSIVAPSAYGDSPAEVLARVAFAAAWLAFYAWGWDAITQFSTLTSNSILSVSWVSDGVAQMLDVMVLGSAGAGALSGLFALILLFCAALALLALILMKMGLLVITAFLFVIGGFIGALYPMPFGRKLLSAYCVAVVTVVALPALWALLFALGAALMLDTSHTQVGGSTFGGMMAQFWVFGATLVTFAVAIKLAFSSLGLATSTISSFATGALVGNVAGGGASGPPGPAQGAHKVHSLYQAGSSGVQRVGGAREGASNVQTQRTRESAEGLRGAIAKGGAAAGSAGAAVATGGASAGAQAAAGGAKAGTATAGSAAGAKVGAERAALQPPMPAAPSSPGSAVPVRSTGEDGDAPAAPVGALPAPTSARETPAPAKPAPSSPPEPQRAPARPRRTDGRP